MANSIFYYFSVHMLVKTRRMMYDITYSACDRFKYIACEDFMQSMKQSFDFLMTIHPVRMLISAKRSFKSDFVSSF
jgi:hypothetical protein